MPVFLFKPVYEGNELKIQHEKLQKCGIATPKNQCHVSIPYFQYHIFNTSFSIPHVTVVKFVIFTKKNRQNEEDSFAEFSF